MALEQKAQQQVSWKPQLAAVSCEFISLIVSGSISLSTRQYEKDAVENDLKNHLRMRERQLKERLESLSLNTESRPEGNRSDIFSDVAILTKTLCCSRFTVLPPLGDPDLIQKKARLRQLEAHLAQVKEADEEIAKVTAELDKVR